MRGLCDLDIGNCHLNSEAESTIFQIGVVYRRLECAISGATPVLRVDFSTIPSRRNLHVMFETKLGSRHGNIGKKFRRRIGESDQNVIRSIMRGECRIIMSGCVNNQFTRTVGVTNTCVIHIPIHTILRFGHQWVDQMHGPTGREVL